MKSRQNVVDIYRKLK